jgi:hypothetical protein
MSSFEKRVSHLEDLVERHLQEAGEVREALVWLKKSHWVLTGAVVAGLAGEIISKLWR